MRGDDQGQAQRQPVQPPGAQVPGGELRVLANGLAGAASPGASCVRCPGQAVQGQAAQAFVLVGGAAIRGAGASPSEFQAVVQAPGFRLQDPGRELRQARFQVAAVQRRRGAASRPRCWPPRTASRAAPGSVPPPSSARGAAHRRGGTRAVPRSHRVRCRRGRDRRATPRCPPGAAGRPGGEGRRGCAPPAGPGTRRERFRRARGSRCTPGCRTRQSPRRRGDGQLHLVVTVRVQHHRHHRLAGPRGSRSVPRRRGGGRRCCPRGSGKRALAPANTGGAGRALMRRPARLR